MRYVCSAGYSDRSRVIEYGATSVLFTSINNREKGSARGSPLCETRSDAVERVARTSSIQQRLVIYLKRAIQSITITDEHTLPPQPILLPVKALKACLSTSVISSRGPSICHPSFLLLAPLAAAAVGDPPASIAFQSSPLPAPAPLAPPPVPLRSKAQPPVGDTKRASGKGGAASPAMMMVGGRRA